MKIKSSKKLLLLWPRYEPGKKEFFKVFLENFDATIIFIAAGEKGRNISSGASHGDHESVVSNIDLEELDVYKQAGKIIFWDYPGFRISSFNLFQVANLFKNIYSILSAQNWNFVLFSTQAPLHSKIAYFICKYKHIRCGAKIERWEDYRTKNPLMYLYKLLDKIIIKGVDATFPHGLAAQNYCKNISEGKSSLILPYLMADHGGRPSSELLDKFVYCGALSKQKNAYGALKAFLSSTILRERAKFVMAGNGPELARMQELVKIHNAEKNVIFYGSYDTRDLPMILDERSVFVLLSYKDGWSFATLEATCLGRPLLLSNRVGARLDLLEEGMNGYSVSTDDENEITRLMEKLITQSPDKAVEMQKISRMKFEEHNRVERVISAIIEVA